MNRRARITVTNVVGVLFAVAALAGLWPAFDMVLANTVPYLSEGEQLILSTLLPAAVLILLTYIIAEARSGI